MSNVYSLFQKKEEIIMDRIAQIKKAIGNKKATRKQQIAIAVEEAKYLKLRHKIRKTL